MASVNELSPGRWIARVRRKGTPGSSKVLPTREEALAWANETEAQVKVAAAARDRLATVAKVARGEWRVVEPHSLARHTLDSFCGVYFLFLDGELVYIGQSLNVTARVEQHVYTQPFDSWAWLPVPRAQLDAAEQFLIRKYKPRKNRTHNRDGRKLDGTELLPTAPQPAPILTS